MTKFAVLTLILILTLQKGSAQWVNLLSGIPNVLVNDITQTPSGNLFAVGTKVVGTTYTPLIFKSQDNGSSWDTILVPPAGYFFNTIAFLNNTIGYIGVGGSAYILQTTDGGNSWHYYYQNPLGTSINDIEVIDSANAVACGFGQNMYLSGAAYTLTNQSNWAPVSQSFSNITLDDLQMLSHDSGYALSLFNKTLFTTNDGGNSWDSVFTFQSTVEKMYWWNSNKGIAVGFNAYYYSTIDGGSHWAKDSITGYTCELTGVAFFDANNGYASSAGGNIFQSSDGGVSWTHLPNLVTTDLYNLEIHGNEAYAVGEHGEIMRASAHTGMNEIKNNNVIYVYPNPAKESIQINSSEDLESIVVTDITGRIILNNKNMLTKMSSMNTEKFPNGIYLIQARSKTHSYTEKIVIQR